MFAFIAAPFVPHPWTATDLYNSFFLGIFVYLQFDILQALTHTWIAAHLHIYTHTHTYIHTHTHARFSSNKGRSLSLLPFIFLSSLNSEIFIYSFWLFAARFSQQTLVVRQSVRSRFSQQKKTVKLSQVKSFQIQFQTDSACDCVCKCVTVCVCTWVCLWLS